MTKIKSFKDYLKDLGNSSKKEKYPAMKTSFGKHSIKKDPKKLPSMETVFGEHSTKKKSVNESAVWGGDDDDHINNPENEHAHEAAPLNKKGITPRIGQVLRDYSGESAGLNSYLHSRYNEPKLDDDEPKPSYSPEHHDVHTKWANDIHDFLNAHKTTEDSHVFTGVPTNPARHFDAHPDAEHVIVHLPAFTSTSSQKSIARRFTHRTNNRHIDTGTEEQINARDKERHGIRTAGAIEKFTRHILKIHVPEGTSAASIRDISKIREEHEILLNRGHNIRIHKTPEYMGDGIHVWNAHIVGHDPQKLD